MKRSILFSVIIFLTSYSSSSQECRDSLMYLEAYNYVINDSIVSGYNIFPQYKYTKGHYSWMYNQVDNVNNQEISRLISQERKEGKYSSSELRLKISQYDESILDDSDNYHHYLFPSYISGEGNLKYNLFFSPIIDNEFFIELMSPMTHMEGGFIYLFSYSEEGKLKDVHSIEIAGL